MKTGPILAIMEQTLRGTRSRVRAPSEVTTGNPNKPITKPLGLDDRIRTLFLNGPMENLQDFRYYFADEKYQVAGCGEVPSTPSHHSGETSRNRRHEISHAEALPSSAGRDSQNFKQPEQEDRPTMYTDYVSTSQPAEERENSTGMQLRRAQKEGNHGEATATPPGTIGQAVAAAPHIRPCQPLSRRIFLDAQIRMHRGFSQLTRIQQVRSLGRRERYPSRMPKPTLLHEQDQNESSRKSGGSAAKCLPPRSCTTVTVQSQPDP